jgi:Flp pilus assembly protein TadG
MIALHRRRRSRGQAMVEFAMVAPIFFLLLFALIDFGRYVYYVQVLNNAAREGARYAIVHGSLSLAPTGPAAPGTTSTDPSGNKVIQVVRSNAVGVVGDSTTLAIVPTWDPNNGRESTVTVTVTYSFRSVIPLVPLPPITIQGASTLVINN